MPASLESPAGTAPNLLLVEEYDALAAAITSALKKFAPRHKVHLVDSLGHAEARAAQTRPQLFILDLDPPQPNPVDFLNRIARTHPDARVLIIASGTSSEFSTERPGPNALQFIEKPFELAEFGAAVQALLGPWTEASSGDSRGTLRDLSLRDLVPLECVSGATVVLSVTAPGDKTGEIHFSGGQIFHASTPGVNGTGALSEMLNWENVFASEIGSATSELRTIQGFWVPVFLEALRKAKPPASEAKKTPSAIPSAETEISISTPRGGGKKVVVIDDTEMLLIFVEDSLSIADPSLEVATALSGRDGIKRVEDLMPDLVLLDYSLPDLRGDQVCDCLLRNKATAEIPIIMMSGHVPEMMATAERYRNVIATIAKPFMSEALVQLVREKLAEATGSGTPHSPTGANVPVRKSTRAGNGKKPVRKPQFAANPKRLESQSGVATPAPAAKSLEADPGQGEMEVPAAREPNDPPAPGELPSAGNPPPKSFPQSSSPLVGLQDIRPAETQLLEPLPFPSRRSAPEVGGASVVLGWGMEVISVEFNLRFQIQSIRVRPSVGTLSIAKPVKFAGTENSLDPSFHFEAVDLGSDGRIRMMRVRPAQKGSDAIPIQNGFQIHDVNLVDKASQIQFTAKASPPMTMKLIALFKVAGVVLSDRFEVAQLALQPQGTRVRLSLDPQSSIMAGMEFEMVEVRLDGSSRISEVVLNSTVAG